MSDAIRDSIINLGFYSMKKQIYRPNVKGNRDNSKCSETLP